MADFGISEILTIAGIGASAAGTIAAGGAQKSAAEFQAKQLEQQAEEERAAAQRDALEKKKQVDFLQSRQQATAASSGLGALDETVTDLAGDIAQEGAYQVGTIQYGGEERAKGRRAQAAASRLEGSAAQTGSLFSAAGTIMGGIGSLAGDYRRPKQPSTYSSRYA